MQSKGRPRWLLVPMGLIFLIFLLCICVYIYIHCFFLIFIYIYIERERERERGRERDKPLYFMPQFLHCFRYQNHIIPFESKRF